MKRHRTKPPPISVPRLDSLLYRLQNAPAPDGESYLDQLMIFLEDPPPGVRDRWKQGAKMCAAWGISCTGPSVWRLYRSYALEWRLRLADEASADVTQPAAALAKKTMRMAALRTFEVLADPQSPPACVVSLARIELRKQALELARQMHRDNQRKKLTRALEALAKDLGKNPVARAAFEQLQAILVPEESPEELFAEPSQP